MSSVQEYLHHETFYRKYVPLPFRSTMRSTEVSVGISSEFSSSPDFEAERRLCDVVLAVASTEASVAFCKDTVLSVPFL